MDKSIKIIVPGGTGFVGKRVVKRLKEDGYNYSIASLSTGMDFREMDQVMAYFEKERPSVVINCLAYVGGIKFNSEHEGEIYYNNILQNVYLQEAARKFGVKKIINPIANCSYPDVVGKDFKEAEWWDGPLHPSVMVYGFARKANWVQAYGYHRQYGMNFVNLLAPNMYGPEDHFDEVRSHAMGALIMKIIKAKEEGLPSVSVWGSGKPVREWLYVDDFVETVIRSLDIDIGIEPINVGQGVGISIADMAYKIKEMVGYTGELVFDANRPDGAAYKIMNVDKFEALYKWKPSTTLDEGIAQTVAWYYTNILKYPQGEAAAVQ